MKHTCFKSVQLPNSSTNKVAYYLVGGREGGECVSVRMCMCMHACARVCVYVPGRRMSWRIEMWAGILPNIRDISYQILPNIRDMSYQVYQIYGTYTKYIRDLYSTACAYKEEMAVIINVL